MDLSNLEVEINPDYTMMKKVNTKGLYLSQEQIDILKSYNINYMNCSSIRQLMIEVEEVFEECGDDILNNLLNVLAERDYYENYKK
jgi:uncharacterized protein YehS (DUF1456 family)